MTIGNLTGYQNGNIIVLTEFKKPYLNHAGKVCIYQMIKCKCLQCGNIVDFHKVNFMNRKNTSCGKCVKRDWTVNAKENNEMIGKKFGKLTILAREFNIQNTTFRCQCDCGNLTNRRKYDIKKGKRLACSECTHGEKYKSKLGLSRHEAKKQELLGKKFGPWTVEAFSHFEPVMVRGEQRAKEAFYSLKCECGHIEKVPGRLIKRNKKCPECKLKKKAEMEDETSEINAAKNLIKSRIYSIEEVSIMLNIPIDKLKELRL